MGLNDFAEGPFRRIEPGSAARRAEEARAAEAEPRMRPALRIPAGAGARKAEQERRDGVQPQYGFQLRAATGKPFEFPRQRPAFAGEALPALRTPKESRPSSQPEPATPALAAGTDGASTQSDRAPQVQQRVTTSVIAALGSPFSRLKAFFGRRRQTPARPPE
jgi:hypothetical protein